jgi:DNA-binding MarR family transcriptional regulator
MTGKPFYSEKAFDCRTSIGYLTRRLQTLAAPQIEARFAASELTFTQWIALMGLREGIANTCADIAHHLGHDTGATTRLLDQLEARGLVARKRDRADRRVVNIALTAKGRALADRMVPRVVGFWNEMLEGFSLAESAVLVDLLARLLTRVEQKVAEPPAGARAAR